MIKIILGSIVSVVLVMGGFLFWFSRASTENSLFKVGSCLRDDEMGVTYLFSTSLKGAAVTVVTSDKYPSCELYRVGHRHWFNPSRNPQKLYPVPCPIKG